MIDPVFYNNGELRELKINGATYTTEQLERIVEAARRWRDALDATNVSTSTPTTHTLVVAALTAEHALLNALNEVPS